MHVNEKMRHAETIAGMGGGDIKKNDRKGKFTHDML
jgi:hypothetical protein